MVLAVVSVTAPVTPAGVERGAPDYIGKGDNPASRATLFIAESTSRYCGCVGPLLPAPRTSRSAHASTTAVGSCRELD
jgi:hypothetical protein